MLNVSDLVRLAASGGEPDEVAARSPARFAPERRRAPVVVWNVCRHCNQSCPHCYAAASSRPSRADLSTQEAHRVIDDLADTGVRFLIFSGGEPLLRRDLFELIAHATARGIDAQLSTNGTAIDRSTARRLAEVGVRYVGVSIDGVPAFNDSYRGMSGGFALASAGLRHARAAGMRTGIRMTVTRRNEDQLDALLSHARFLRVDRFYVSHLVYAGRGRRLVGDDLSPAEARTLLLRLFYTAERQLRMEHGPKIVTGGNDSDGALLVVWTEMQYGKDAAERVRSVLRRRGGNSAGEGVVCIDDRGRVHPDQFWQDVVLGDVREQPLREILDHPMVEMLRGRAARLSGRCGQCPFLDLCRGSHRERAVARFGEPWASDPSCVLSEEDLGAPSALAGGAA